MNFLSINSFSKEEISVLINRALEIKKGAKLNLEQKIMNVFLEPSTRTLVSFQMAQEKLGMKRFDLPFEASSFKKGESLEDTILNLKAIGINNFVIRSSEEKYWEKIDVTGINIINGGDGKMNHPSQALLDATTIFEEFGTLENLIINVVGDTKHSRVYHSLKELMNKFNSEVISIGPKEFDNDYSDLKNNIPNADVVIMLRIQHERHDESFNIDGYNAKFGLNKKILTKMKGKSIFMHPGPVNRGVEISEDILYSSSKSKILQQVENGVFCRMAILEAVCKNI